MVCRSSKTKPLFRELKYKIRQNKARRTTARLSCNFRLIIFINIKASFYKVTSKEAFISDAYFFLMIMVGHQSCCSRIYSKSGIGAAASRTSGQATYHKGLYMAVSRIIKRNKGSREAIISHQISYF